MKNNIFLTILLLAATAGKAEVWQPDLGNGRYKNPVICADYSDPDVIRVGDDYYLTSSSFHCVPALQILHSRDLVNWEIIAAADKEKVPFHPSGINYGKGVWAPSIRYHNGLFYIFYGDPDRGIVRLTAKQIEGPWEEKLIMKARGYIDPCPLWDDDGRVWLVHALAGSRAGLKSVILLAELDSTASEVIAPSRIIFDGHETQPTCEGPKLYKRGSLYYIFMPAGGVRTGWQTVLRSKNISGPWEEKIVLEQGDTDINGPHQGAWVTTQTGEDWFLHFQDKGALGRVVHLQPMTWKDDWPVIGRNGKPVKEYKKPDVGEGLTAKGEGLMANPQTSDEFTSAELGLQWQWMAAPEAKWHYCNQKEGLLRLYSAPAPDEADDFAEILAETPNLLMQKLPAERFTVTARVRLTGDKRYEGETGGIVVSGKEFHSIRIINMKNSQEVICGGSSVQIRQGEWVYLRAEFSSNGSDMFCAFSMSHNAKNWTKMGGVRKAEAQKDSWTGCKVGLFCLRPMAKDADGKPRHYNDGGWLDIDWWRVE